MENFLQEIPDLDFLDFFPAEIDFTDAKRVRVSNVAVSICSFLDNVVRGDLPGLTALEINTIRQAYHRFSSRSHVLPYSQCRLGPRSLRMNLERVLHA